MTPADTCLGRCWLKYGLNPPLLCLYFGDSFPPEPISFFVDEPKRFHCQISCIAFDTRASQEEYQELESILPLHDLIFFRKMAYSELKVEETQYQV